MTDTTELETTETYNSRNADKFVVRLPEGMRQNIATVAKKNFRSMNSDIINRLDRSLKSEQVEPNELDHYEKINVPLTAQEVVLIEKLRSSSEKRQQAIFNIILNRD